MARSETFRAAQQRLLGLLAANGWAVASDLKVPHATTPETKYGQARLYFTPQAVQLCMGPPFSLSEARSMWVDIRGMNGQEFVRHVERWMKPDTTPNKRSAGHQDMPGGWRWLTGDINWEDYGGMWGKRAADGSWFVVRFENWEDLVGEREAAGGPKYRADVLRVVPGEIDEKTMKGLLSYTGLDDVLEEMSDEHREMAIVESAVGYGAYETMQEFTGNRADVVRAAARRYGDNITR